MRSNTSLKDFFNVRILLLLLFTFVSLLFYSSLTARRNEKIGAQEISLEAYCKDGYYEIPNEPICSRAPYCGTHQYDDLDKESLMPNPQQCMGDGDAERSKKGCAGYVPLCCYEMARTGKFTKCIGYWERLWCSSAQCKMAKMKGASDSECGGSCNCGHAHDGDADSYCKNDYVVPLSDRLSGVTGQPTPSASPVMSTTPAPTVVAGQCPTTSSNTYESWQIDQNSATNTSEAKDHPDKNIHIRGWESSSASKQLYNRGEPIDSKSPQLSTLLDQSPAIVSTYKVYDWNWSTNTKGSLLGKYDATMIGLSANSGAVVRVPDAKFDLIKGTEESGGYTATILYADANSLTIKYTLQDDVVSHYTVHLDNFCVDPNLLSLYNQLDSQKYPGTLIRYKLPILKGKQPVGTSNGSEVRVTIRNSGEFIDPRLINSFWRGVSTLPTAGPTVALTPGGPTVTPGGSTSPTATPKPGSCSTASVPVVTSPTNSGALPGKVKLVWKPAPGAKSYAIRIDDMTNGWKGDCSVTQNSGDLCVDNISGSTTTYEFTGVEGHTYYVWLHSINYCGNWSDAWQFIITTPPVNPAGTCRIQGYREVVGPQSTWKYGTWIDKNNPQYSHTLWVPEALRVVPVSATGGTVMGTVQENPYFITVAGNQTYTVTIQPVNGYSIASTYCVNSTACHGEIGTNQTLQNGNTRTVTCPAGGYADLWWLFFPSTIPTMSVPRPTATPGGANLTPTVPAPTDTPIYPSPTPSPCPEISPLEWREGDRYTRTIISYDGVNIIENISLHLKQITQSGLVVQVSTDGGTTWAASDSSQDDDHFVTIKNRNTEVINLKVRLLNSCSVTSPELSQSIKTVPLPSTSPQVPIKSSAASNPSPLVPALIVGGAVLTVAAVAVFFFGI